MTHSVRSLRDSNPGSFNDESSALSLGHPPRQVFCEQSDAEKNQLANISNNNFRPELMLLIK